MKISVTTTAAVALFVVGLFACSSSIDENKKNNAAVAGRQLVETKKLPSFSIRNAAGETVNLSSLKGKKVFLNLWATWCPPCRQEIPSIEKLYSESDKNKVVFVLLSLDENFEVAKEFAASNGLQAPIFYAAENLPDLFNVRGIPATFIFNEEGELIKQINSMEDYYTREYIELLN